MIIKFITRDIKRALNSKRKKRELLLIFYPLRMNRDSFLPVLSDTELGHKKRVGVPLNTATTVTHS